MEEQVGRELWRHHSKNNCHDNRQAQVPTHGASASGHCDLVYACFTKQAGHSDQLRVEVNECFDADDRANGEHSETNSCERPRASVVDQRDEPAMASSSETKTKERSLSWGN